MVHIKHTEAASRVLDPGTATRMRALASRRTWSFCRLHHAAVQHHALGVHRCHTDQAASGCCRRSGRGGDSTSGLGSTKPFPQRAFVLVRLGGRCSRAKMRLSASGYRLHKAGRLPRNHPARNFSISPTVRGTPELNSSHPLLVTMNSSSMRMPKPLSAR